MRRPRAGYQPIRQLTMASEPKATPISMRDVLCGVTGGMRYACRPRTAHNPANARSWAPSDIDEKSLAKSPDAKHAASAESSERAGRARADPSLRIRALRRVAHRSATHYAQQARQHCTARRDRAPRSERHDPGQWCAGEYGSEISASIVAPEGVANRFAETS